jgi:hypothetical protein
LSIINNHLSIIRGEVLFLNVMKKQNTVFTLYSLCPLWQKIIASISVNLCSSVVKNQLVRRSLGEGGSIKNNKLCKTNPISQKVKRL